MFPLPPREAVIVAELQRLLDARIVEVIPWADPKVREDVIPTMPPEAETMRLFEDAA